MPNHIFKPLPVTIKYSVDISGVRHELTLDQLWDNPLVPYGEYKGSAPGIGEVTTYKMPDPLHTRTNAAKLIRDLEQPFKDLWQYVYNKERSNAQKFNILSEINKSAEHRHIFMQALFTSAMFNPEQKKTIFNVLLNELRQDCMPIIFLVMQNRKLFLDLVFIFGVNINKLKLNGQPMEFNFVSGAYSEEDVARVMMAWRNGLDPNRAHTKYGTILHVVAANESQRACDYFIKELSNPKSNYKFDFTSKDWEQKTILLLSTKLRQFPLVEKLCALIKQNINIGIDIPDAEGRTPLMYAAALGCKRSFLALTKAGADRSVLDNNGNGLDYYLSAPKELISEILLSIDVEPERDIDAEHSWLYFNDAKASPLVCNSSTEKHKRVLISFAQGHEDLLKCAFADVIDRSDIELFEFYQNQMQTILIKHFDTNLANLKDWIKGNKKVHSMTVLDSCVEGQQMLQNEMTQILNAVAVKSRALMG